VPSGSKEIEKILSNLATASDRHGRHNGQTNDCSLNPLQTLAELATGLRA
jgi:hypothetical protein